MKSSQNKYLSIVFVLFFVQATASARIVPKPLPEIPPVGSESSSDVGPDGAPAVMPADTCRDETQDAQRTCEQNKNNMASCESNKALYNELIKKKDDKDLQTQLVSLQKSIQECSANLAGVIKSCDAEIVRCAGECAMTLNKSYAALETDPGGPAREKNLQEACLALREGPQKKNKFDLSQMAMMLPQLMQLAMALKSNLDSSKQTDLKTSAAEPPKNTMPPAASSLPTKTLASSTPGKGAVTIPNFADPGAGASADFKTAGAGGGGLATGAGGGAGGGGSGLGGSSPSSGASDSHNLEGNEKTAFDTNIVQGNPSDGSSGSRRGGGGFMRGMGQSGEVGASSMRYMGLAQVRGGNSRSIASGQVQGYADVTPAHGNTNFEKISMRYKRLRNTFLP